MNPTPCPDVVIFYTLNIFSINVPTVFASLLKDAPAASESDPCCKLNLRWCTDLSAMCVFAAYICSFFVHVNLRFKYFSYLSSLVCSLYS